MIQAVTIYKDCWNQLTKLTEDELRWFDETVACVKRATDCTVPIIPYDHELYTGKSKNALGTCCTTDPGNQLGDGVDTYITIDCYFINECYRHVFHGDYLIAGETLVEVLAHEIAHLTVWRHGKKHTALTAALLEKIEAAERKGVIPMK